MIEALFSYTRKELIIIAYYATQIDYDLAKKSNPNANVQLYTGQKLGAGDYALGGVAAGISDSALNGATRLAGADRDATNALFSNQAYTDDKNNYLTQIKNYQNNLLQAQQQQKQQALQNAYQNNTQSLGSQKSTVNNAYSSAVNSINATKQAQLPQYQQQRNAASADAAQTARKVRELMAATGRFNSGTNRSQQLAVDLNRQNAIQGLNQGENQFTTQIANQLSEADNNKASALSDIASKLALLQRQYNDGTLSLTNQMESEKAAAASKAFLDAQAWADATQQRGVDNSFRQGQFDYQKQLDSWNQDFQSQKYGSDQALQLAQLMGSYNGAPTLAAQQMTADQAYKNAALSKSSSNNPSVSELNYQDKQNSQQATSDAMAKLQEKANLGWTRDQVLNWMYANSNAFIRAGADMGELSKLASQAYRWNGGSESRYE